MNFVRVKLESGDDFPVNKTKLFRAFPYLFPPDFLETQTQFPDDEVIEIPIKKIYFDAIYLQHNIQLDKYSDEDLENLADLTDKYMTPENEFVQMILKERRATNTESKIREKFMKGVEITQEDTDKYIFDPFKLSPWFWSKTHLPKKIYGLLNEKSPIWKNPASSEPSSERDCQDLSFVKSFEEFKDNFNQLYHGKMFHGFDWKGIVIAGGCIFNCLREAEFDNNKQAIFTYTDHDGGKHFVTRDFIEGNRHGSSSEKRLLRGDFLPENDDGITTIPSSLLNYRISNTIHIPGQYQSKKKLHPMISEVTDIDLFIYGLTEEEGLQKIEYIAKFFEEKFGGMDTFFVRSERLITIIYQEKIKIQIILRLYKNISEIFAGFDLGCVKACYDGEKVLMTDLCHIALLYGYNVGNPSKNYIRTSNYESRLFKYYQRGVLIRCPGFSTKNIDMSFLMNDIRYMKGLALLLKILTINRRPIEATDSEYGGFFTLNVSGTKLLTWQFKYQNFIYGPKYIDIIEYDRNISIIEGTRWSFKPEDLEDQLKANVPRKIILKKSLDDFLKNIVHGDWVSDIFL